MNTHRRLRIFMHAQHLSGVGHYVRSLEIARALASYGHEVEITDGGKPVPHSPVEGLAKIELPRIHRQAGKLRPLEGCADIDNAFRVRRVLLLGAVISLQPDILVVEHYPFSKWELGDEIGALIAAARSANPSVRVVCSVRDIPRQTRHETCAQDAYCAQVLNSLHTQFDAVMVHAEEGLTRLAEHFPKAGEIRLPLAHTGIVSEKHAGAAEIYERITRATQGYPYILASVGGGADRAGLLGDCVGAWNLLQSRGELRGWRLAVFSGLNEPGQHFSDSERNGRDSSILWHDFSADYLAWMSQAELSITCAGYNTCANLLETRCRAILVPNPAMSDQAFRAQLLAKQGAAHTLDPKDLTFERLAEAIMGRLSLPRPRHGIPLDGAQRAATFVETVAVQADILTGTEDTMGCPGTSSPN